MKTKVFYPGDLVVRTPTDFSLCIAIFHGFNETYQIWWLNTARGSVELVKNEWNQHTITVGGVWMLISAR